MGRAFRARRGIVALVTSLAVLGMCVIPAGVADARPISVPCDKQGEGLIDGINLADSGDDIVVDQNCRYVLDKIDNSTDGDNGLLVITKTLTILGHGAIIARKVSGTPEFRILHVRGGDLTLNDVKTEHGVAADHNATPVSTGNPKSMTSPCESVDSRPDGRSLCGLIWRSTAGLFRSRTALQAEILILRHQLNVLRRRSPKRVTLGSVDRLVFVGLYRLAPKVLHSLTILQPETVIHWHRAGFRAYWRWKSGRRVGRPKIPADIRRLILEMSGANLLWGAPRIHGELLKLRINVGQTTVAKYRRREGRPRRKAGRHSFAIMPTGSRP
jgi:hypothetical protein